MTEEQEPKDRTRTRYMVPLSNVPEDAPVIGGTDVPVQHLIDYLTEMYDLYYFLEDYPQVSADKALAAVTDYVRAEIPAHSDRG